MRTWAESHPKAKLLARKRAAIIAAARRQFLASGYGATSMEGIAADAGVSVATLYRHARSKDELFEAVVSIECDPARHEAGMARIGDWPLRDFLVAFGAEYLEQQLAGSQIAVLRTVIAEINRFPELGEIAYRGLVQHQAVRLAEMVAAHPEAKGVSEETLRAAAAVFMDRLLGDHALRLLLGVPPADDMPIAARAASAADHVLPALTAGKGRGAARARSVRRAAIPS